MKKVINTEGELKKRVDYKKKRVKHFLPFKKLHVDFSKTAHVLAK